MELMQTRLSQGCVYSIKKAVLIQLRSGEYYVRFGLLNFIGNWEYVIDQIELLVGKFGRDDLQIIHFR